MSNVQDEKLEDRIRKLEGELASVTALYREAVETRERSPVGEKVKTTWPSVVKHVATLAFIGFLVWLSATTPALWPLLHDATFVTGLIVFVLVVLVLL